MQSFPQYLATFSVCCALQLMFNVPHTAAIAQTPTTADTEALTPQQKEFQLVFEQAVEAGTRGPGNIALFDQGSLSLPEGYIFFPAKEGAAFMRVLGNATMPGFIGLILPISDELRWFIAIDFAAAGYVRDDDAKRWNADDILSVIRDRTEAENNDRITKGIAALDVVGWIEPPRYDKSTHQLVWSMLARERGSTSDVSKVVNYNTLALGREGFLRLLLITPPTAIAQDKIEVQLISAALHFNAGKRYEDFAEGRDHVAEYGLAALIAGVAAKKLGVLALVGAFLLKMWKVLVVVGLGLLGAIGGLFKRRAK